MKPHIYRIRKTAIFILFIIIVSPGNLSAYRLYLKPTSIVSTDSVLLKDIARIDGDSSGLKVVFASNDRIRILTADDLRTALKQDPLCEGIYGTSTVIIPLKERPGKHYIETLLKNHITSLEGGASFLKNHQLELTGAESIQTGPNIDLNFDIQSIKQLRPGKRVLSLDIVSETKERILYRQKAELEIKLLAHIPVASKALKKGDRVSQNDFSLEIRPVFKKPASIETGSLVMKDRKKGDSLGYPEVQNMPDIKKGQTLELVYQKNRVVVKVRAIADESGIVGQFIRVRVGGKKDEKYAKKARIVSDEIAVID